jgi:hypothetical protein
VSSNVETKGQRPLLKEGATTHSPVPRFLLGVNAGVSTLEESDDITRGRCV